MTFKHWYHLAGPQDTARVDAEGFTYLFLNSSAPSAGWQAHFIDLSGYQGRSEAVVEFNFTASPTDNLMGWYLDDIELCTIKGQPTAVEGGHLTVAAPRTGAAFAALALVALAAVVMRRLGAQGRRCAPP